ncbi:MAG TPA: hypothetical protein HA257_04115 [Candidatus Methanoperedenaceae archaeon]|nr:hypothetical protein [Candidatus Methanoperedenaceae archaeon]
MKNTHPRMLVLTADEIGREIECLYENVSSFKTDPDVAFNYAHAKKLMTWGFMENCSSCMMRGKVHLIVQTISVYKSKKGAASAYSANVKYLTKNDYGKTMGSNGIGEDSILIKKVVDENSRTYNLIFLKNNVLVGLSLNSKSDSISESLLIEMAGKIEQKIQ